MQKDILGFFWKFSGRYKWKRFFAVFFPILAVSINTIAAPFILASFLDLLQHGQVSMENSIPLIALYGLLVFVGEVLVWRLALYFTWTFEATSQRDIYSAIFSKDRKSTRLNSSHV